MESPREIYQSACAEIAETLRPPGFKFAKSGPHARRQDGDFIFTIHFQSSHRNVAGHYVALWVHAIVRSSRLKAWRDRQAHPTNWADSVAGGHIGNLVLPSRWRECEWNLAESPRAAVVADAVSTIRSIALPYFARFANPTEVCDLLQREELPAMDPAGSVEFLLCFADRTAAATALCRFFRSHPELLSKYHSHLLEFRETGLPQFRTSGYARDLAYVTASYDLTAPVG